MYIHPTAVIHPTIILGKNVIIREFCSIGADPCVIRRYKYQEPKYSVTIGNNVNIFARSHIARGTLRDTVIGNKVVIGQDSNIGHDCIIGEKTLVNAATKIAGHVEIGKQCNIGMGSMIREHTKIGDNTVIGMMSIVTKDVPSNVVAYNMVEDGKIYCRVVKQKPVLERAKSLVKKTLF